MKKKHYFILTLLFLFGLVVFASAQYFNGIYIDKGFLDGNKYLSMDEGSKRNYICGIRDGMLFANILMMKDHSEKGISSIKGAKEIISTITEYTSNVPAGQLNAIIEKYMRDNPHKWNEPMNGLVFGALAESVIKSKKEK
jgi:hypothetical protein